MAKAGPEITVHVADLPEVKALVDQISAEYERLHTAASRVVQLANRDQVIATHEAIPELRRVLDEQGGGRR